MRSGTSHSYNYVPLVVVTVASLYTTVQPYLPIDRCTFENTVAVSSSKKHLLVYVYTHRYHENEGRHLSYCGCTFEGRHFSNQLLFLQIYFPSTFMFITWQKDSNKKRSIEIDHNLGNQQHKEKGFMLNSSTVDGAIRRYMIGGSR